MNPLTVAELVKDRRSDALITVPVTASVADAVAVMAAEQVGAVLAMTEERQVAGLFSERDLLARVVAAGRDVNATPLAHVMTRDLKFVSPDTPTEAALALMHLHHLRHLLVIDGPYVHGLISMRDLVVQIIRVGEGRYESAVRAATLDHSRLGD
jgi:CBS domain-containing protein